MKLQFTTIAMASALALSSAELLKDIYPGPTSSNPIGLTLFDDQVYFAATAEDSGTELYITDGEPGGDGTMMLKDINPGSGSSNPSDFVEFNGMLFFCADDGTNGNEMWVTDGTAGGTELFLDINEGSSSSNPSNFVVVGERMFFEATTVDEGTELWATDGTVEGTKLFQDIQEGPNSSGLSLKAEQIVGRDTLVFVADDGTGQALWGTNATSTRLVQLQDLSFATSGSVSLSRPMETAANELFFAAGNEFWVTDGTASGTRVLLGNVTVGGPSRISSYQLGSKTLFFAAKADEASDDVWETGGTPDTTRILDIALASTLTQKERGDAATVGLGFGPVIDDKIALITDNGVGVNIWVTDGTEAEQLIDATFDWVLDVKLLQDGQNALFVIKNGTSLETWVSDYTASNTKQVGAYPGGYLSSVGEALSLPNGQAIFTVASDEYGVELWTIDLPKGTEDDDSPTKPTRAPTSPQQRPSSPPVVQSSFSAAPLTYVGVAAVLSSVVSAILL